MSNPLNEVLREALTRGLVLLPCQVCHGSNMSHYIGEDGMYYDCEACDGTGHDSTPWGIVGAVRGTGALLISQNHLSYTPNQMRHQWEATVEHAGTDAAIAEAALTAWLQVHPRTT